MLEVKRISAITVAATVGILSVATLGAAPAASAAPCYGYSCRGYDPSTMGCNNYYSTSKTNSGPLATIVNWYSTGCNANWAQAWLSSSALAAGDTMFVEIYTHDSQNPSQVEDECYPGTFSNSGNNEWCTGHYGGSAPAYTDMVDGTNTTYSSVVVYDSTGNQLADYPIQQ
jgi:hypothetical protein